LSIAGVGGDDGEEGGINFYRQKKFGRVRRKSDGRKRGDLDLCPGDVFFHNRHREGGVRERKEERTRKKYGGKRVGKKNRSATREGKKGRKKFGVRGGGAWKHGCLSTDQEVEVWR